MHHTSRRRRIPALFLALVTALTAAFTLTPSPAMARVMFADADLSIDGTVQRSGQNRTVTIRVTNSGPEEVLQGDYEVALEWAPGAATVQSGCTSTSGNTCVINGLPIDPPFCGDPVCGLNFRDFTVRLRVTQPGALFATMVPINLNDFEETETLGI